ncbi:hypothetical protein SELMODRAFT_419677 [Selaginella moellendorffii]|uniref:Uncharacterized protein n=1 Tax=Selaginella moellendorffii TaxID=88036 RepID=D8S9P4_SELML|nr:hypothetical protein SELMODRAFT_419677 [Selaginella moellendorffii]
MPCSSIFYFTTIVSGFAQVGSLDHAMRAFHFIPEKSAVSWNAVSQIGQHHTAFDHSPDRNDLTWTFWIAGYAQNGHMEQDVVMFALVLSINLISCNIMLVGFDSYSWGSLVSKYARNGYLEDMEKHRDLHRPVVEPEHGIVAAFSYSGLGLYHRMEVPDEFLQLRITQLISISKSASRTTSPATAKAPEFHHGSSASTPSSHSSPTVLLAPCLHQLFSYESPSQFFKVVDNKSTSSSKSGGGIKALHPGHLQAPFPAAALLGCDNQRRNHTGRAREELTSQAESSRKLMPCIEEFKHPGNCAGGKTVSGRELHQQDLQVIQARLHNRHRWCGGTGKARSLDREARCRLWNVSPVPGIDIETTRVFLTSNAYIDFEFQRVLSATGESLFHAIKTGSTNLQQNG